MGWHDAVRLRDENGVPYGIRHADNKPRVSSMPYVHLWGSVKQWNVNGKPVMAQKCKRCGKIKCN
jgi:hypothetical protein